VINKEVRALLPAWAACALAIPVSRWNVEPFKYLGVPAFFLGTAALGAWVMGHEYADGTLASLLTIPVPRRRVWITKLAVLAPMLAALAAIGRLSVQLDIGDLKLGAALFILPPIVSLFVAPWLTMLTRSPLAGAVFTFAALGGSLAAGEWIGDLLYGYTQQVDVFRMEFLWWSLAGLTAVAAVLGWRGFATLEALDGHDADIELPSVPGRARVAAATRRHPLLRLIAKELRLQQLAIVVAVLWALVYTTIEATGHRVLASDVSATVLAVFSVFYTLVLPVVIGSLACAEERHFGTLDTQLLLPVRCSTQWFVKSATALGLAVTLALLLPVALARLFGDVLPVAPRGTPMAEPIIVVLGVTSISLYVSTLARSGLRALMGSIAAVIAFGFVLLKELQSGLGRQIFRIVHEARPAHAHTGFFVPSTYMIGPFSGFVLLALLLVFALPNYRYTARRPALVAVHVAILAACLLAYDVVMSAVAALRF
jgi:ABC-2 family transporter